MWNNFNWFLFSFANLWCWPKFWVDTSSFDAQRSATTSRHLRAVRFGWSFSEKSFRPRTSIRSDRNFSFITLSTSLSDGRLRKKRRVPIWQVNKNKIYDVDTSLHDFKHREHWGKVVGGSQKLFNKNPLEMFYNIVGPQSIFLGKNIPIINIIIKYSLHYVFVLLDKLKFKETGNPLMKNISFNNLEYFFSGMTQMSYFSAIDGQDVAHFSHPFTLDLFFDINRLDQVVNNLLMFVVLSKHVCF